MPEGVSGEEGICPTEDSDGVRHLSKRVEGTSQGTCLKVHLAKPYFEQGR